jgi:peptidoglycan hydrolase-like protein with peptidoglycan-binding domain
VPSDKVAGDKVAADKPADPAAAQASPQAPKPAPEPSKTDKNEEVGPPVPSVVPPVPVPAKRPRTAVAAVDVDEAPQRVPVGDSKTEAAPVDRAALTREIQRHLKRVGCYRGDVTGVWSPSVRQAMRAFTEGANASLPVDGPDPVLLAMVQSHGAGACSATCPQGQDRAANGQCLPSALVASATAKGGAKAAKADAAANKGPGAETVAGSAPPPSADRPPDGRMSLAGPSAAPQAKAPRRSARVAGWSRSAQAPRPRRAQRSYSGYSGLPGWAFPFFGQ